MDLAQPLYFKRILGIAAYDDLTNAIIVNSGLTNFTGFTIQYQNLLNQIRTPLCYCAWYEAFPFLHFKMTNKGITLKSSIENDTTPAKMSDIDQLRTSVFNWASFYLEEFKQFLRNNRTDYPLWKEDIFYQKDFLSGSTSNTRYFTGFEFGDNFGYISRFDKNNIRHFINPDDL